MKVNLSKISQVDKFLQVINKYPGDFVLEHETYNVNAKSLLGVMSLDLDHDLILRPKTTVSQEILDLINKDLTDQNLIVK